MIYSGYAFKPNMKELQKEISDRYKEICDRKIVFKKRPHYSTTYFEGTLSEDQKDLSELDILILADDGNLCFGGKCTKNGLKFSGCYHTD